MHFTNSLFSLPLSFLLFLLRTLFRYLTCLNRLVSPQRDGQRNFSRKVTCSPDRGGCPPGGRLLHYPSQRGRLLPFNITFATLPRSGRLPSLYEWEQVEGFLQAKQDWRRGPSRWQKDDSVDCSNYKKIAPGQPSFLFLILGTCFQKPICPGSLFLLKGSRLVSFNGWRVRPFY